MPWCLVRLELGDTKAFPSGSASRCYHIRAPLHESGLLDEHTYGEDRRRASARRYWPDEPDRIGYLLNVDGRWVLSFDGMDTIIENPRVVFKVGNTIWLREPSGKSQPFRVAAVNYAS